MDEVYKLDYEDEVGGVKCRFKYAEVEPQSFGLSTEDILFADDDELNKFVSLKHLSAYKHRDWSKHEADTSKKRKRLRALLRDRQGDADDLIQAAADAKEAQVNGKKKAKQGQEGEEEQEEETEAEDGGKKRRRRKKKAAPSDAKGAEQAAEEPEEAEQEEAVETKTKKAKKSGKEPA
jgi:protein KRI1